MPDFSFIIYIGLYLLAGSFLTVILSHTWINRKMMRLDYSTPLLFFSWCWLTSQLLEYIFPEPAIKMVFHVIQYSSIPFIPLSWLIFCMKYTESQPWRPVHYWLAGSPTLAMLVLVYTNHFHRLLWKNISLHISRIYLIKEFGVGIFILLIYVQVYFIIGFVLMLRKARHANRYERKQIIIILCMAFIPYVGGIIDFFIVSSNSWLLVTPLAISISSLFMIYFARLRYYRTIPLTQHIVTQSLLDICIILNPDNYIIYCNPAAYDAVGLPVEEVIGKPLEKVFNALHIAIEKEQLVDHTSFDLIISNIYYHVNISPIYSLKRIINRVLILRDITHLKKTEESLRQMKEQLEILVQERTRELEQTNTALREEIRQHKVTENKLNMSLAEKDILMGEIHHRVKNNLQVIISMLKLQKRYINDEKGLEGFNTAISRIKAIAIIHEKLYKSDDLANTNLAEYIKDLTRYLLESNKQEHRQIELIQEVDSIYLDLDRSITSGLIINELVTNAFKYAFPGSMQEQEARIIRVYFLREGEDFVLGVKDNGIGLPAGLDISRVDSLGMKIVFTLANQLSGDLSITRHQGTDISIRFPR